MSLRVSKNFTKLRLCKISTLERWQIFARFLGDYKKLQVKILKILETLSELIHKFTCYKLLLNLESIPICNVVSGEWLSCFSKRDYDKEWNLGD